MAKDKRPAHRPPGRQDQKKRERNESPGPSHGLDQIREKSQSPAAQADQYLTDQVKKTADGRAIDSISVAMSEFRHNEAADRNTVAVHPDHQLYDLTCGKYIKVPNSNNKQSVLTDFLNESSRKPSHSRSTSMNKKTAAAASADATVVLEKPFAFQHQDKPGHGLFKVVKTSDDSSSTSSNGSRDSDSFHTDCEFVALPDGNIYDRTCRRATRRVWIDDPDRKPDLDTGLWRQNVSKQAELVIKELDSVNQQTVTPSAGPLPSIEPASKSPTSTHRDRKRSDQPKDAPVTKNPMTRKGKGKK